MDKNAVRTLFKLSQKKMLREGFELIKSKGKPFIVKPDKSSLYNTRVKKYVDGTVHVTQYKHSRTKPQRGSNITSLVFSTDTKKIENTDDIKRRHMFEVKTRIKDYVLNNSFDTFWTLTFDPKIYGVTDNLRFEEMGKFLTSLRKKYGKFNYIAIPERHKNGTLHWHMITGGISECLVKSEHTYKGQPTFECPKWKYGFTKIQVINDKTKVANYVTKYITKSLMDSPVLKYKKKYWSSKGLKLPETRLEMSYSLIQKPDWQTEDGHILVKNFTQADFEKYAADFEDFRVIRENKSTDLTSEDIDDIRNIVNMEDFEADELLREFNGGLEPDSIKLT